MRDDEHAICVKIVSDVGAPPIDRHRASEEAVEKFLREVVALTHIFERDMEH